MREARLYITPDQIGDNQPDLDDEITLSFAGSNRVAQIVDIDTKRGGQDLSIYFFGAVLMAVKRLKDLPKDLDTKLSKDFNALIKENYLLVINQKNNACIYRIFLLLVGKHKIVQ